MKRIKAIRKVGSCPVYDIEVAAYHNFVASGVVVHNCTEKGAQRFFEKAKPESITDIAALTSIYRPGPLSADVDKTFISAKKNPEKVTYEHPLIKECLEETYGAIIFQEQIMKIANVVGGLDLDECDKLRKVITKRSMSGKSKAEIETEKLKVKFVVGAQKNGLTEKQADDLFEKLKFFSGYGFNKSLAADTVVDIYTSDGKPLGLKAISDVEHGEYVRSRDEETSETIFVKVSALHDHDELDVVEVRLTTGEKVVCTLDHKFMTQSGFMLPLWQIIRDRESIVVG